MCLPNENKNDRAIEQAAYIAGKVASDRLIADYKNDPATIASEKMAGAHSFSNLMLYRQTVALESIAASLKNIDVNGIVSINRT